MIAKILFYVVIFHEEAFSEVPLWSYKCKATVALPSSGPCLVGDMPMVFHLLNPLLCYSSYASRHTEGLTPTHTALSQRPREMYCYNQLLKNHRWQLFNSRTLMKSGCASFLLHSCVCIQYIILEFLGCQFDYIFDILCKTKRQLYVLIDVDDDVCTFGRPLLVISHNFQSVICVFSG